VSNMSAWTALNKPNARAKWGYTGSTHRYAMHCKL
jgi:hypothetical protein